MLSLGEELEVTVEDIDPQGKISLRPVEPARAGGERSRASGRPEAAADSGPAAAEPTPRRRRADRDYVSFEDSFEDELRREFGDLGPAGVGVGVAAAGGGPEGDRGGERRGGGGGDRRPRRPRRR